jgi:hypothetical protein
MSASPPVTAGDAWLEEGRRSGSVLDGVGSAVVVGRDAEAAAWVALGLARAQAIRRRVAVADLVGEVPPLQSLVDPDSDPHGISDSFLYGVSLNKIAHPVDTSGNLFVLPSGSEAVATDEVFRSDRWRRLASGFREVGALLLLVAQSDTPGLDALATMVDGVVIAGDASSAAAALADAPAPIAVIAPSRRRAAARRTTAKPGAAPEKAATPSAPAAPRRNWVLYALLGVLLAGGLSFWLWSRSTSVHGDVPVRPDSARAGTARPDSARPPDSAAARRPDSTATAPPAPTGPLPALTVANPADSTSATAYSVVVSASNTPEGASLDPRTMATLSVTALTPVLEDGAPWYRLLVGAYPSRAGADSLLGDLQRRGVLGEGSGLVVRTPYALLVADHVPAADVRARVQSFLAKNIPLYALSRGDGTVALYAGAFERPEQAAWLARVLQTAGVTPTLVYRTGRSL